MSSEFSFLEPEDMVDLTDFGKNADGGAEGISMDFERASESQEKAGEDWNTIREEFDHLKESHEKNDSAWEEMKAEFNKMKDGKENDSVHISKEKMEDGTLRESIRSPLLEKMIQQQKMEQAAIHDTEEAAKEWHMQKYDDTCNIVAQQFILNEYTKVPESEDAMRHSAINQGWYVPGEGTLLENAGKLLELYGIHTTEKLAASFDDILQASRQGERMIAAVNAQALATEYCDDYPLSSANHAIEIVTVDAANQKVIINDPGAEDGCLKEISYDNFKDAWFTGWNYLLVAHRD